VSVSKSSIEVMWKMYVGEKVPETGRDSNEKRHLQVAHKRMVAVLIRRTVIGYHPISYDPDRAITTAWPGL